MIGPEHEKVSEAVWELTTVADGEVYIAVRLLEAISAGLIDAALELDPTLEGPYVAGMLATIDTFKDIVETALFQNVEGTAPGDVSELTEE